jgi:hypothetical protein
VDAFTLFFKVLYLVRMRREGEDKLWWVPLKEVSLVLNLSTVSWVVMMVSVSHGRMFGRIRYL